MRSVSVTNGVESQKLAKYKILSKIGEGPGTTIQLAEDTRAGRKVALKVIDSKYYPISDKDKLMREVIYHQKVSSHPNIVSIYDHFKVGHNIYIEMQFASGGDLFNMMKKNFRQITDRTRRTLLYQVCSAIECIHQNGMIHRDIKPENVLLDEENNAKLCDFGWTCHMDDIKSRYQTAGTFEYMSPECLRGQLHGKPADIWSLGILTYELYHGVEPFPGQDKNEVLGRIYNTQPVFYDGVPDDVVDLFQNCVRYDPATRPSIEMLLKNRFFDSVRQNIRKPRIEQRSRSSFMATSSSVVEKRNQEIHYQRSLIDIPTQHITIQKEPIQIQKSSYLSYSINQVQDSPMPQEENKHHYVNGLGPRSMSTGFKNFSILGSNPIQFIPTSPPIDQREAIISQSYLPSDSPTNKISQLIMAQGYQKNPLPFYEQSKLNKIFETKLPFSTTSASPNFRPEKIIKRKGFQLQLKKSMKDIDGQTITRMHITSDPKAYSPQAISLHIDNRPDMGRGQPPADRSPATRSSPITPYNMMTGGMTDRSPVMPFAASPSDRSRDQPLSTTTRSHRGYATPIDMPPKQLFLRSTSRSKQ